MKLIVLALEVLDSERPVFKVYLLSLELLR